MNIFKNPEFLRLARSKLRQRSLISYGLVGLLLFGGIMAFAYFVESSTRGNWTTAPLQLLQNAFHNAYWWIIGFQMATVSLYGMTLAAQNITLEKERGTFDFQRLVAMGPTRLTVGKLWGAPVEAYYIALIGVPFALLACMGSDIGFAVLVQSEIVVFVTGFVVCSFGLLCSSIVEKTNQSTGLIMIFGVPFYGLFGTVHTNTIWSSSNPIHVLADMGRYNYSALHSSFSFCNLEIPVVIGFLVISGLLVWLNVTVTARRIADVELSYVTPRQGLIIFGILQMLLLGNFDSSHDWSTVGALQTFHAPNLFALLILAFALTPGAELVRGRVLRQPRNQHWPVVFERTNRLQDSPAVRAMLELCAVYVAASVLNALLCSQLLATSPHVGYQTILLTIMVASLGVAMTALLLYIQVYTERGCFKIGIACLILGLAVPPFMMMVATIAEHSIPSTSIITVSPIGYVFGFDEFQRYTGDWICPAICLVLAVAFCILSGLRIRFLLDVAAVQSQKPPAPRGPTLEERMRTVATSTPSVKDAAPNP